jgi:CubicO group peptidase (beta-lactamase class C family)
MFNFRSRLSVILVAVFLLCPFSQESFSRRNSLLSPLNESFNRLVFNKLIEEQNSGVIDGLIEKFRVQNGLKGVAVAVVKDEKLVFARGYGFSNEEDQVPATPNNLFRLASVSKLITAVAVMKLVENSKISLESKVFGKEGILSDEQFLNIKDTRLEKITVRNLLNHSGGWTQH